MISATTSAGIIVFIAILAFVIWNIKKKGADILSIVFIFINFILLTMIILPEFTYNFIISLGFLRPEIAFLSIVSITAFFMSLKLYFKQREIEKEITKLSREFALNEKK